MRLMRRREFVAGLGGAALWPLSARAQQQTLLGPSTGAFYYYGLRSYKCVGSIAGGSNVLQLTEASTFKIGDQVIVEVGGETGKGQFGTMGVGGIVPAATDGWKQFYYRSRDLPKALVAKVTALGGRLLPDSKVLLLDKQAATTATNANVYLDNAPFLQAALDEQHDPGWTVSLPSGDFAVSDRLNVNNKSGWTIKGAGKGLTVLRAPKGTPCFGIGVGSANTTIQDLTIIGNAGEHGFGLKVNAGGGIDYGSGLWISRANCVVRNVSCVDVFRKAVWGERVSNLQVSDCDSTLTEPFRGYLDWWFGASDSDGCTFTRCRIDNTHLAPGFETFRSNNIKFIDCVSKNGTFSSNSSGNFLLDGFSLTVTAGSKFDESSFSHRNPSVDINSNIRPPNAAMPMGGTIKDVKITVQGPIDAFGNLLKGIVINDQNSNVTVNGGIITYPNGTPGAEIGPFGVISTGTNTVVRNLTVTGKPANSWEANIDVHNGIVSDCRAERIKVDSQRR
jgi:hypothetical protein